MGPEWSHIGKLGVSKAQGGRNGSVVINHGAGNKHSANTAVEVG